MTYSKWQQFLSSQGAHWHSDGNTQRVMHFGDDANNASAEGRSALAGEQSILCDLSHYSLLKVSGEDSETFLQNQFCNDVRNVSAQQSQLNAYCTPKGRALAFFRLFQREEDYYLRLPSEILETTLNRLRMFVMRSKLELSDSSDDIMRIGFAGAHAGSQLGALCGEVPSQADAVIQHENLTIICTQPNTRFEIYADTAALQSLWQQLSSEAMAVGAGAWELLDIHAALPEVYAQTQEAFVPQMLNLQAINALSFKKGCYPGQEIVARMHYLGKLKRRMFVAHIDSDVPVHAGDTLHAEGSESAQGVGKVVRAQRHPDGGSDLLAVIEISSAAERTLHLQNEDGPLLSLLELPYVITEAQ